MKRERIRSFWNKPSHAAYLFIAPAGILLFVFCIIPLMASLVISTFKMGVDFHSADFIAFDNYVKIFPTVTTVCTGKEFHELLLS